MASKYKPSPDVRLIRRLLAVGCPIPSNKVEELQSDLTVEASNPASTIAYDRRAGAEYIFSVRITNVSYRALTLYGVRVRMPWVARLNWLGDPAKFSCEPYYYRLPSGRKFPYREVINHLVRGEGELGPGASFEGLLLAYTLSDRISPEYLHRDTAPTRLFVIDQFGRKHRSEIEITVDRSATMRPFVPNPNRKSLFEERRLENSQTQTKPEQAKVEDGRVRVPPVISVQEVSNDMTAASVRVHDRRM